MNPRALNRWVWMPPLIMLALLSLVWATDSDQRIFLLLNRIVHHTGESWWAHLTILGDGAVALALVFPGIRRMPQRFWAALIAAILVALGIYFCKKLLPLPRPLSVLPAHAFFQSGPALRAGTFPSGHSATIFTLVGIWIVGMHERYLLRSLLLALAVLVSASRIMVGVHWPTDVLAGMSIGWIGACLSLWISSKAGWKTDGVCGYLAAGFLAATSIVLVFSRHTGFPAAFPFQQLLGLSCLIIGLHEIWLMRQIYVQNRKSVSRSP